MSNLVQPGNWSTHALSLSNEELLARLPRLCSKERDATAEVIVYLAEVDRRRLYLESACSSLHSCCSGYPWSCRWY